MNLNNRDINTIYSVTLVVIKTQARAFKSTIAHLNSAVNCKAFNCKVFHFIFDTFCNF